MVEGCEVSEVWNRFLSAASALNIALMAYVLVTHKRAPKAAAGAAAPDVLSWEGMWGYRPLLALVYVVACAVRSIWPRHDADRVCFFDHPISPPLYGRTLAFFAELSFAALICMTVARIAGYTPAARRLATTLFLFNVVAQNCCNYAVFTTNQIGHVIEESIWLVSGVVVTLYCLVLYLERAKTAAGNAPGADSSFLRGAILCGPVYVLFMAFVDVPMYYNRAVRDEAANRTFVPYMDGVLEASRCFVISCKDDYWVQEIPWLTGYFTLAVWATLWIAKANIPCGGPAPHAATKTKKRQ
jgi:hypothetical protein